MRVTTPTSKSVCQCGALPVVYRRRRRRISTRITGPITPTQPEGK